MVLYKGIGCVVVRRVGLLTSPLRLVVSPVLSSLSSSMTLLVIGGGFIREVMFTVDMSLTNKRI